MKVFIGFLGIGIIGLVVFVVFVLSSLTVGLGGCTTTGICDRSPIILHANAGTFVAATVTILGLTLAWVSFYRSRKLTHQQNTAR